MSRDLDRIGICTGVDGVVGRTGPVVVEGGLGASDSRPASFRFMAGMLTLLLSLALLLVPVADGWSCPFGSEGGEGEGEGEGEEDEDEAGWI